MRVLKNQFCLKTGDEKGIQTLKSFFLDNYDSYIETDSQKSSLGRFFDKINEMEATRNLKKLSKKDIGIAGGKGASLGEIARAGIPVPPGFVILAGAFDRFLEETDINVELDSIIKKINYKDINSVDAASNKIRDLIMDAQFPDDLAKKVKVEFSKLKSKYAAVRSSATAEDSSVASWAGELESYLNTSRSILIRNIKKCWASLFTPRAIFYRFENKLHTSKVSVAVVVQKMVQSKVSGICFTVHPVTENNNQMVIEAGYGLGEAIVGGVITPDSYVVDKKNWAIIDTNISRQKIMVVKSGSGTKTVPITKSKQSNQKLSNKQIITLSKICREIEKHYNYPQDIEWAMDGNNKFYIVQSRPITTLK